MTTLSWPQERTATHKSHSTDTVDVLSDLDNAQIELDDTRHVKQSLEDQAHDNKTLQQT